MKLQSLHLRRILATSATAAVILGAAGGAFAPANAASGPSCDANSCTEMFSYTGATETFTVPTGVSALTVSVWGAQGGWTQGDAGGGGARVGGVLPVTSGEDLTVLVGQSGTTSGGETFGGGGASPSQYLASGGGGSFIFDAAGNPLVVAGGGGGATIWGNLGGAGAGAASTGGSGAGIGYDGETPPTGGSPTAPGAAGSTGWSNGNSGSGPAANGLPGQGGDGGGVDIDGYYPGAGGGGGYFGGGGGAYAQAGAGGSGFADPSVTDLTSTDGANAGDGAVSITWALLPQVVTFTSSVPASAVAGTTLDVTTTGGASGNPVTLSVDSSTTNSACSITGSTVSFDHAGTCVVDADQVGNDQYGSAVTAQESVVVTTVPSNVSVATTPTVFGQAAQATATVTNGGGTPDGTVQFAVDGNDVGSPVTLVGGSAQSPSLTTTGGDPLAPGGHAVTATYTSTDPTVFAGSLGSATQVINQASTTTAVSVDASSISATVAPVAPGAGVPTGTVTFSVAGQSVGTANLASGSAVLAYVVPSGMTQTVAAVYSGDDSFMASSDSTSRSDPSITATVTSAHAKSASGWYRSPVTVTFTCTPNGAPLTAPCPDAVTFTANGAAQSVTRTIAATDGGVATLTVGGINEDHTAPSVSVSGIKNGAGYGGQAPAAHCVAKDSLSGMASCTISRHTSGSLTSYTATATDKAGNVTTTHGSYHVLTIYVQGTSYSAGAFALRAGHSYTVVVINQAGRPTYYDAALFPHKPSQRDMAFNSAGHHRWALGVTLARSMRSHHYWYLGVKVGHTMHSVKVRVTG